MVGDEVAIFTRADMGRILEKAPSETTELSSLFTSEYVPYLKETPSSASVLEMIVWFNVDFQVQRGTPVRTKLVEMMSWDIVK
jgi:hypothetical protein